MSQFQELLASLKAEQEQAEALAKSLPAEGGEDDKAIQAAAAEGDPDADDENPEDDDDAVAPVAKSVMANIDGEEVEAIDATDLLKSLDARVSEHDEVLAKALASTLDTVKAQGEIIKSMQTRLDKLAGAGKGRKTVLAISEKPAAGEPTMAKSQLELTPQQFMAKAMDAMKAGKLSGQEVTTADVCIRQGFAVPDSIVAKALS